MSTLQKKKTALHLLPGTAFYPQRLPDPTPTIKAEGILNKPVIRLLIFPRSQQSYFSYLWVDTHGLMLNTVNTF